MVWGQWQRRPLEASYDYLPNNNEASLKKSFPFGSFIKWLLVSTCEVLDKYVKMSNRCLVVNLTEVPIHPYRHTAQRFENAVSRKVVTLYIHY